MSYSDVRTQLSEAVTPTEGYWGDADSEELIFEDPYNLNCSGKATISKRHAADFVRLDLIVPPTLAAEIISMVVTNSQKRAPLPTEQAPEESSGTTQNSSEV